MNRITVGTTPSPSRRAGRGFTLVEMLVVIGITALLISIVLPSLNAARKHAERVACAANLRSVGQAYHIYANEYKGEYAPANNQRWPNGHWGSPVSGPAGAPDGPAIVFSMGHFPDPRILYCPSTEADTADNDTASGWDDSGAKPFTNLEFWNEAKRTNVWYAEPGRFNQTGYAMWVTNDERFGRDDPRREWFPRFKDESSERVMASDHMMRGTAGDRWTGHLVDSKRRRVTTAPLPGFPADPDKTADVNFEGGNVLYNDGRVEWKSATETVWRFVDDTGVFHAFW